MTEAQKAWFDANPRSAVSAEGLGAGGENETRNQSGF
jgi:hypothetical protein